MFYTRVNKIIRSKGQLNLKFYFVWGMGLIILLFGVLIQLWDFSEVFNSIKSGADAHVVAEVIKSSLLFGMAYLFLFILSLISIPVLKYISQRVFNTWND